MILNRLKVNSNNIILIFSNIIIHIKDMGQWYINYNTVSIHIIATIHNNCNLLFKKQLAKKGKPSITLIALTI